MHYTRTFIRLSGLALTFSTHILVVWQQIYGVAFRCQMEVCFVFFGQTAKTLDA